MQKRLVNEQIYYLSIYLRVRYTFFTVFAFSFALLRAFESVIDVSKLPKTVTQIWHESRGNYSLIKRYL